MFSKSCIILLTLSSAVFGATIIDSEITSNDIEQNDAECSNGLSPALIEEIQSHQPVVDQIVSAVVNGHLSGDTWNA